jgi:hypothetical protein
VSQSTLIALAIVLLFLVYIAARGRLPDYMRVFGLARGTGADSKTTDGGGTQSPAGTWTDWITRYLPPELAPLFKNPVLP